MRRLPPLSAVQTFEAAARHLSFQRAAQELHVTPSAVSHQIRVLEDFLAVRLFIRRPRQVALTSEGQAYLDRKSTRLNSSHSQQSRMPSSA